MITPAPYWIQVQPSPVDTREEQRPSGLMVVRDQAPQQRIHSGVVLAVGAGLDAEWTIEVGNVLYYLTSVKLGEAEFVIARWDNVVVWDKEEMSHV